LGVSLRAPARECGVEFRVLALPLPHRGVVDPEGFGDLGLSRAKQQRQFSRHLAQFRPVQGGAPEFGGEGYLFDGDAAIFFAPSSIKRSLTSARLASR